MVSCANYLDVIEILERSYEIPSKIRGRTPLDELILVILSQNTNDNNSLHAFEDLLHRFDDYHEIAKASGKDIADAIRRGGLANNKAKFIKKVLESAYKKTGNYTLDFLDELNDKEALDYLTSLEGVGPKSARCVLLFSLGRDLFPVDTHVFRVSKRIGLIPSEFKNREKACEYIEARVKPVHRYKLHMVLIYHGRAVCKARKPDCGRCTISHLCDFFGNFEFERA
jgi:endonuclease III